MTASVAILGLIPMLISTALTLLLLPLIYEWSELRVEARRAKALITNEGGRNEGN